MSSYLRYGFIENLDTVRRIPIGRFWGVGLLVTPLTWLSPRCHEPLRQALRQTGLLV